MKKLLTIPLVFISSLLLAQEINATPSVANNTPATSGLKSKFSAQKINLSTGVELEYVEYGDPNGKPLILLHGLSDSWHSFENVLPHLPASIHAFAITMRGHGNSDKSDKGFAMVNFAEDVAAFIRQKNLAPVVIAGHSLGGIVAQQFALDYPRLTKSLVIIDSDPDFKNNPGMTEFYQSVMAMEGSISREFMIGFQKETLANPIDSNFFNLVVEEGLLCPLPVFQSALTSIMQTDLRKRLRSFNKPTLIFWGDRDSFCNRKGQDELKALIPRHQFIEYLGTGHALHWEKPESFARDLAFFILDQKR